LLDHLINYKDVEDDELVIVAFEHRLQICT
jgi:hypothetical protein